MLIKIVFPFVEVSREFQTSPERLWNLLTDTSVWVDWGPSITAVQSSDRYVRQGSRGRVKTRIGLWVPFDVTYLERGRCWSWRVFGVRATGHRIEPLGGGRCRLVFEIPLVAAPYALVCKMAMNRIARLLID